MRRLPSKFRLPLLLGTLSTGAVLSYFLWQQLPFWLERFSPYPLPTHKIAYRSLIPRSPLILQDHRGQPLDYWDSEVQQFFRPLVAIDPCLPEYVVFMEDAKFFAHEGFDVAEIRNSFKQNLKRGKVKRGASTITQQLAKNLFLDRKRSWIRKFFEVPWTLRLEEDLSKRQILELYLNLIEWGPDIYGAEAAARYYFDRSAAQLTPGQCMYLALIVPSPVRFDARKNPKVLDFLRSKQSAMVRRLVDEKKIPPEQESTYLKADFGLAPTNSAVRFYPERPDLRWPIFAEMEKQLQGQAKGGANRQINSSLDRELMQQLHALPEHSGGEDGRYVALWEGEEIRALRYLSRGKSVDTSDVARGYYRSEVLSQVPWKTLLK